MKKIVTMFVVVLMMLCTLCACSASTQRTEDTKMPKADDTQKSEADDTQMPETDDTQMPETDDTQKSEADDTQKSEADDTQMSEDKQEICKALTDIKDWDEAHRLMEETVELYRNDKALQYAPHGVYNLEGGYKVTYKFAEPNDFYEVKALDEEADLVIVIHNTGDHGISFWSGIYTGGEFKGLTENYILFTENDNIMAVSILERKDCKVGECCYYVVPFKELSRKEQDTAIFPSEITINKF